MRKREVHQAVLGAGPTSGTVTAVAAPPAPVSPLRSRRHADRGEHRGRWAGRAKAARCAPPPAPVGLGSEAGALVFLVALDGVRGAGGLGVVALALEVAVDRVAREGLRAGVGFGLEVAVDADPVTFAVPPLLSWMLPSTRPPLTRTSAWPSPWMSPSIWAPSATRRPPFSTLMLPSTRVPARVHVAPPGTVRSSVRWAPTEPAPGVRRPARRTHRPTGRGPEPARRGRQGRE